MPYSQPYSQPTPQPGTAPPSPTPGAPTGPYQVPTSAPTDPAASGTDVYGLTPDQENWSIYQGDPPAEKKSLRGPGSSTYESQVPRAAWDPGSIQGSTALDLMKYFARMGNSANPAERQMWANTQRQFIALGYYGQGATEQNVNLGPVDGPGRFGGSA